MTPPITTAHTREIGSYFQDNYRQGEPIEVPSHVTDWIAWKNSKLQNLGFYDEFNMRFEKHKKTEDEPPRIHLRGDGDFPDASLSDGHLEFKVCFNIRSRKFRLEIAALDSLRNRGANRKRTMQWISGNICHRI